MNPIGALQRWAIAALAVIIVGGAFGGWMRHRGYADGEAAGNARIAALQRDQAQALADYQAKARAQERTAQAQMAALDARHAQELKDAQAKSDAVVADLRAGTLRLRQQWRGCEAAAGVSGAAAGASQPDAAADNRAASAGRIVRVAAEADATIRALQAVVRADRAAQGGTP